MTKDNNCPVCGSECLLESKFFKSVLYVNEEPPDLLRGIKSLHRIAIEQGELLIRAGSEAVTLCAENEDLKQEIERLKALLSEILDDASALESGDYLVSEDAIKVIEETLNDRTESKECNCHLDRSDGREVMCPVHNPHTESREEGV